VSRIAIRPDQRCTVAIQAGAACRVIRAAVMSWTTANTTAAVVSQALAYNGEEKPPTSSAYLVGWCSLAYKPSTRATPQPLSRATRSGLAYWSRAG
jgi:ABC-type proline/glycine betaine transport system substrate-binding protein